MIVLFRFEDVEIQASVDGAAEQEIYPLHTSNKDLMPR